MFKNINNKLKKTIQDLFLLLLLLFCPLYIYGQDLYNHNANLKGGSSRGLVGTITSEFNVSQMGQATYNIPIEVPAGAGALTPHLSVCYSSSTSEGLFGHGTDLGGLSMISRVPADMIHDGEPGCVDVNIARFALDGTRLIEIERNSEYITYATEVNNYSRIRAYGDEASPNSFVVDTKDGLRYTYQPNNQLVPGSPAALFWVLTKVSDTNGNYYNISYRGDNRYNEIYPVRIDYTGNENASVSPQTHIDIIYRGCKAVVQYVSGMPVSRNNIVWRISISSDTETLREYDFTYNNSDSPSSTDVRYYLTKVTESAPDGKIINPTEFEWSEEVKSDPNMSVHLHDMFHKAKITIGDFNGDGKSDAFLTPQDRKAGWSGYRLFLSDGDSLSFSNCGVFPSGVIDHIECADFNGDGMSDIIVMMNFHEYYSTYLYQSIISDNVCSFADPRLILQNRIHYKVEPAELNGDGAADLIVYFDKGKECETYCSVYNNGVIYSLAKYQPYYNMIKWDQVEFLDYNGDGITDIMNLDDKGYTLFPSDGKGLFKTESPIKGAFPTKKDYLSLGDLNGDGKTDMVITGNSDSNSIYGWVNWILLTSDGTGVYSHDSTSFSSAGVDRTKKVVYLLDINGDGMDDLFAIDALTPNSTMPQCFINKSGRFSTTKSLDIPIAALDKSNIYFGDFNGDGKVDILTTSNWSKESNWRGYLLVPMLEKCNNLVTKITDGLGNDTEIIYKPMSDPAVHQRGYTLNYPVTSFCTSWPLVYQVKTPDGVGGKSITQYKYTNALRHSRGRGVLGFEQVRTLDLQTNAMSIQYNSIEPNKYMLLPTSTVSLIGEKALSSSYTDYHLALSPDTSAVFSILTTKTLEREHHYYSQNRIREVTTTMTYDDYGNQTKLVTDDGRVKTTVTNVYKNDLTRWYLGRLTSSTVRKKLEGAPDQVRKSSFTYDTATGLLSSESIDVSNKKLGYKKTYNRDVFGNITESTITPVNKNVAPRTTKSTYDATGRFIVSTTNSLGFTTTHTIDNNTGAVLKSKDANGNIVNYQYDSFGNLKITTTDLTTSVSVNRWSAGFSEAPANSVYFNHTKNTGESYKWTFYDCLGRCVRSIVEDASGYKKIYTDVVYNSKGQVEKTSDPYFSDSKIIYWTTNEYDACGRLIKQTAPNGAVTTYGYDGSSPVVNSTGEVIDHIQSDYITTVTDPLGRTSSKKVDCQGNLECSTDANGVSLQYSYDASGHATEIHGPRTTIYMEYDIQGNRIYLDDPDAGVTESEYNAYGELVKTTNSKGTILYEYDNGGRLVKEIRPDVTTINTYDTQLKGYLSSTSNSNRVVHSYTYDRYGRVLSESQTEGNYNKTYSVSYTYNNINKVATVTYPSSSLKIRNSYTTTGVLEDVYNANTNKSYWHLNTLKVNARGQIQYEKLGNGLITEYVYDPTSGLLNNRFTHKNNNRLLDWNYNFNYNGCLLERRDNKRNLSETFTYDNLDRLHTASKNGVQYQRMEYDAAGNIIYKSDVGTYTYVDGSNRLATVSSDNYSPKEWDFIDYTSFNKISHIQNDDGSLTLNYGVDHQRISSHLHTNGHSTDHYYFGDIYEEIVRDYDQVTKKCYIFAGDKRIALVETHIDNSNESTQTYYFHHDHLGSVMAYSDSLGNIVQELSYDAWGRRRNVDTWEFYDNISDAAAIDDYGFGEHEHIDLFEMVNMDGRMYDPVLGRFLSPDPIVQAPDFTQSFNRYAYCINNPLSLTDPSGYSWKSDFASIVGTLVSAIIYPYALAACPTCPMVASMAASAAGGAARGLISALLNGSNIGNIIKAYYEGAFWGAVEGAANYMAGGGNYLLERMAMHAFFEGSIEFAQGGNIFHGFINGASSCFTNNYISKYSATLYNGHNAGLIYAGRVAAAFVSGGTISTLTGGKFANGAITSAFSMLFNDMGDHGGFKEAAGDVLITIGGVELAAGGVMLADDAAGVCIDDGLAINCLASGTFTIALGYAIKTDFSDLHVLYTKTKQSINNAVESAFNSSSTSSASPNPWGNDPKLASLIRKAKALINAGKVPKSNINRIDPVHTKGGQPHAHFKNGAINQNGTIKEGNPWKNMTNKDIEFLNKHGFKIKK